MAWNWQHPDWPNFRWNGARLAQAEARFLIQAGTLHGFLAHLDSAESEEFRVEALSSEALTTSEIEGETLDRASVQSSIRRQLGLRADDRNARPAERGISEVMVSLHRGFDRPLTHNILFEWHRMVMAVPRAVRVIGAYRTHTEPMQIASGRLDAPTVHFEAPPSSRVPEEMERYVAWFNSSGAGGGSPLPPLARAAVSHVYFESIHPFEDGNGRVGRALAEMALSQSLGRPSLTVLAATILRRRRSYYDALQAATPSLDLGDWTAWFAGIVIEAQLRTINRVHFLVGKSRFFGRFDASLNPRQRKAMLRVLAEGPDGFTGGLSAGKYVSITRVSPATARRDLGELVERGALARVGERRHARYHPTIAPRPTPRITVNAAGELIETPDPPR